MDLKRHIREIPDFPKPGTLFYDLATLFLNAGAFGEAVTRLATAASRHSPQLIAGIESRGFPVAAPIAIELGLGLLMIRKPANCPEKSCATAITRNTAVTSWKSRLISGSQGNAL